MTALELTAIIGVLGGVALSYYAIRTFGYHQPAG
jgi:hypothetical protein